MQKEIWRAIDGYNYYEISDLGNVRSKDRLIVTINGNSYIKRGHQLKPKRHKDGYLFITLTDKNNRKNHYLHRLVANSFIENEENKPQVNHLNGNKTDNTIENLEWATNAENSRHAYNNGLYFRIEHLKPTSQAVIDTSTNTCYPTIKEAANALNRNYTVVREMLKGKRNKTIPLEYCNACS